MSDDGTTSETSQTPSKTTSTEEQPFQPPTESEAHKPKETPKNSLGPKGRWHALMNQHWFLLLVKAIKTLLAVGGCLVSLLWAVALWDSYRPKITVTPGLTFNTKEPFATAFIIQNEGALPIRKVSFNMTWTYADDPNQMRNVQFGMVAIPELKPLEQHVMGFTAAPTTVQATNMPLSAPVIPMPIGHHSLVLWFDVTYDPQYFGRRTTTLYFVGGWDVETNFQWLPTGSVDIRTEPIDPELVNKAQDVARGIALQRAAAVKASPTNGTIGSNNSVIATNSPSRKP
jgi:hypothetical protein